MKYKLLTITVLLFSTFLMSPSCEKQEAIDQSENKTETPESIAVDPKLKIAPLTYTFHGDYIDLWKSVDSLQGLGLYRSAVEKVQQILDKASSEENAPQVVKAVIHKMQYNSYLEEDDFVLAINELNKISGDQSFPLKQIVHSVTAQVYWGYYQSNRWQFLNRTQTINFKNDDVRTWDLTTIADHVNKHYHLSLTNKDSLQAAAIDNFSEILIEYKDDRSQRPTLYDFLAHRALDHFENQESELTRPAAKFLLEGVDYFGSDEAFNRITISSTDSMSNHYHAAQVFQELSKFHLGDKDPSARIDLNLRRLHFAHRNSTESHKEDLYFAALEELSEKFKSHQGYSEIRFEVAQYLNQQAVKFNGKDEEYRWQRKKALEICEEAIKKYPNSLGAEQCRGLVSSIKTKALSFNTDNSYSPNLTGKMLINYTNVDTLHFKLVRVSEDYFFENDLWGEELIKDLLRREVVLDWTKIMENPGDYQQHSTEIKINNTQFGQYVVLASPNKEFMLDYNAIAYGSYWVTNLSYSFRRNNDETIDVFVADRMTGEPISGVKATVLERKYNYTFRKYDIKKQESYTSDKDGMFTISSKADYRYMYLELKHGNDQYNNSNQLYQYRPYNQNNAYTSTTFFTDRSIYRPGQTIHFKGIRIHHNGDKHTIEAGKTTTVALYDANYQKVSELKLTTNEYGTFSGTFTAPVGLLNGQMRIDDGSGSKWFSVEEYKRPKFEVAFEPVEGEFRINDKITVKGFAKAYAGSNVDGAQVRFRVQRDCSFPYWGWYRWGYYPYSASVEITNGTVKTDENGEFLIEFEAKEDPTIQKKFYPNYSYTVSADVTDVNGETHSSSQWVAVGYNCMNVSLGIGATIENKQKNRFKISTTNLNGVKVNATGTILVHKQIEPEGVYRTANWIAPDIQEFNKEEYRKLFPNDAYEDELDVTKYPKGEKVLDISFNTATNDSIDFTGMRNWKPGRYVVECTSVDKFGETVKDVRYLTLLDKSATSNPTNDIWLCNQLNNYCEPGESAEFLISSSTDNFKVIYELEHKGKIVAKEVISLSKGQKLVKIPIKEEHRGNLTVHFGAIKLGRSHISKHTITVPYSNKDLDIEFETFRNKLLPGQKEEWKLKIKGPKGEKVAAEMLATMYDASLDAFASNGFYMSVYNSYYSNRYWSSFCFGSNYSDLYQREWNTYHGIPHRSYDRLNWWNYNAGYTNYYRYDSYDYEYSIDGNLGYAAGAVMDEVALEEAEASADAPMFAAQTVSTGRNNAPGADKDSKRAEYKEDGKNMDNRQQGSGEATVSREANNGLGNIQARSNFNETAFFYPQLETDAEGSVILTFTIPEALTRWKFLGMAHTKDLKLGYIQEEVVTQKELMVMPNAPRFFREGDKMTFTAKVSNLSEGDMNGTAQLMLFDALTMKPIDDLFKNSVPQVDFSAKKGQSAALAWEIEIPYSISAVTYRVVAKAGNFTDGEEMAVPVLSNRMLVTESMPLPSKGIGTKDFTFEKLVNSGSSSSIKHHKLTLEYTSNPAWYAVQAMPYMMEYPYECAEQVFTRYYANSLASTIMNSNPKIKNVFESWKASSPDAFLSNLEKNQELKSLMLEETPWVLDAQNESERKKRVGLLFDLNKMDNELSQAMRKLQKMQVSNGGWPWFPGMEESRYITQHVITGMGHLDHLGVKNIREDKQIWNMVTKGIGYLDQRIIEDYEWLKAHDPYYLTEQRIGQIQIQYLYARSYFKDLPMNNRLKEAFDYYQNQAEEYWKNFNLYNEGMIALQAKRYEIPKLPEQIMASLKERAIVHEELGMYWKDNVSGYYWYQAPIETQSLLIEAFDEVTDDQPVVEELKVWLLKQKQTTDWKTTKATAEACYALLLRGTDLLANDEQVEIRINNQLLDPKALGAHVEAGTGYFKTSWTGGDIKPEMGNVSVTRKTEGVSWGAMYWQYFEDLDKITTHETPLKLSKTLFLVKDTESGPVITPIEGTKLKPGDKVRVRIELRSDRDMEYVHMKDMRAAGFEPVNVFSRYKWQDGLGYFESTKDAATNFFIEYLHKGTYVFEYDLRVSHAGNFSNGITTIQCMYAPEFTSHSEGVRVEIDPMEK